ncbi:MAG TPA: hypothetical protein VEZ43_02730 [Dongiaceae bacterium]|nr:hypothetical protein [Dongiaceae bacterium]
MGPERYSDVLSRQAGNSIGYTDEPKLASKPVMLLGNLTSILLTIVALLQALSWTIAGILILATLSITTLLPLGITAGTGRSQTKKPSNHLSLPESKYPRERTQEKQVARPHQVPARPEQKSLPKHEPSKSPSQIKSEFQKTMIPKITLPKTIPGTVSPARSIPTKSNTSNQAMLKPIPPKTPPAILNPPKPVPTEPELGKPTMIDRGDYVSYDVQLDQGKSITCEVTANGRVNFYLLDEDNLTSLDLGEEFWSETGEEDTEKATLEFKAPENGKWFLVVENTDSKEVSATVNIRKTPLKTGPSA